MVALVIIVALLVVAGVAAVLIRCTRSAPVAEVDLAQPYREGLHAAVRLQRVAQDLEAAMYAEAAKRIGSTLGHNEVEP